MYLYQCVTHRGFHATAFSFYENYGVSGTGCRLRDKPREAASRTGITAERWSKSCGMTTEIAAIARRFRPVKVLKTGTAAPVVPSSSIPSNIESPVLRISDKVALISPVPGYDMLAARGCAVKYSLMMWAGWNANCTRPIETVWTGMRVATVAWFTTELRDDRRSTTRTSWSSRIES